MQEHNHVGNEILYRLAIGLGITNIGLGFTLLMICMTGHLNISNVIIGTFSAFVFYMLFALQSLLETK